MIRQTELHRILGRRLTMRLVCAAWIAPTRIDGGIFYSARDVRRALSRLSREGFLLASRLSVPSKTSTPKRVSHPGWLDLPSDHGGAQHIPAMDLKNVLTPQLPIPSSGPIRSSILLDSVVILFNITK